MLMLLLVALLLTGCDSAYDLTIENNTDQEVVVLVDGWELPMRPCSVRGYATVSGPPFQPIEVEVKDAAGNQMYIARIRPQSKDKGLPEVYVRIPPEGPGACSTPVLGKYMLTLRNRSNREVVVWLAEVQLGPVRAGSAQTFGPLPGTWQDAKRIEVRDSLGNNLLGKDLLIGVESDYSLGQVPEVFVDITPQ
jgi:hypothetical protein